MAKAVFYKIGRYEILLNNVDAVTDIEIGMVKNTVQTLVFEIIVDGAIIFIHSGSQTSNEDFQKVYDDFVKAWKESVK